MRLFCCDCKCPVDADAKDIRHCRNEGERRILLPANTMGAAQCCRCADLPGKSCCLYCIESLRKNAVEGERKKATTTKRKASRALDKTNLGLDAERKDYEKATSKVNAFQKKIRDLEDSHDRIMDMDEVRRAVEASIGLTKLELADSEQEVSRRKHRIEELERNKRRRKIEEIEAIRTLEEITTVEHLLSPYGQTSEKTGVEAKIAKGAIVDEETVTNSAEGPREGASESLRILAHFSQPDSARNSARVAAEGGIETVIAGMRKHDKSSEVQEHRCAALGSMGCLPRKPDDTLVKAGEKSGARAMIAWMEEHGYTRGLEGDLPNEGIEVKAGAKGEVEELEVIAVRVLAVMKKHATSSGVQEHGCRALWMLSKENNEMTRKIGKLGGIEAVIAGMNAHGGIGLQTHACTALGVLAHTNSENTVKIGVLGGIEAVLEGMTANGESASMLSSAFKALWVLAHANDNNRVRIGAQGGMEAVIEGMRLHGESAAVQEHGCRVLMHLALNEGNRVKIGALGGIEAVIAAMKSHGESTRESGCTALGVFALNRQNCVKIGAQGGIEAVITWMKQHGESARVLEPGCTALGVLALNVKNRVIIGAQGGVPKEVIAWAQKEYKEAAAAHRPGLQTLAPFDLRVNSPEQVPGSPVPVQPTRPKIHRPQALHQGQGGGSSVILASNTDESLNRGAN